MWLSMPALFYRCCTYPSSMNLAWLYLHMSFIITHVLHVLNAQCFLPMRYAPSDPTPLLEAIKPQQKLQPKHATKQKHIALMATEASECKAPVNACCVVDEQGDIHDNAYACIILPLLCGHQPEVRCLVRWFPAIGSGSRGLGSG